MQIDMTIVAECHCLSAAPLHDPFPFIFSGQVFQLSDVMYFNGDKGFGYFQDNFIPELPLNPSTLSFMRLVRFAYSDVIT